MLTGSKTELSLAKAEPISNGGSASVITYITGKSCCMTAIAAFRSEKTM